MAFSPLSLTDLFADPFSTRVWTDPSDFLLGAGSVADLTMENAATESRRLSMGNPQCSCSRNVDEMFRRKASATTKVVRVIRLICRAA